MFALETFAHAKLSKSGGEQSTRSESKEPDVGVETKKFFHDLGVLSGCETETKLL